MLLFQVMLASVLLSQRCIGLITKLKSGSARNRTWGLPRPQTTRVCCPLHHWTRIWFKQTFIYIVNANQITPVWWRLREWLYLVFLFKCDMMFACIKATCLGSSLYYCKAYQLVIRQCASIRMVLGRMAQLYPSKNYRVIQKAVVTKFFHLQDRRLLVYCGNHWEPPRGLK